MCVSVCSLISHSSYLMSVVLQAAGPISREPSHDSDFCRLVAGGCDSERKGEGGEGEERSAGCQGWDGVSSYEVSSVVSDPRRRTRERLEITTWRPSATSANYLEESRPGSEKSQLCAWTGGMVLRVRGDGGEDHQ